MEYIVSVVLVTYNQKDYIRQSIESVLAQKTKYLYEVIIGDDCSSDGTREICLKYAMQHKNIKVVERLQNLGVAGNWADCVKRARGKYVMMLDGDDYWHNPNKIQLQVDFMEQHPECVICHTDIDTLYLKTGIITKNDKQTAGVSVPQGYIQRDVLSGREKMNSSTMCLRTDALLKYIPFDKYVELNFPYEDWPTIVILSAYGEIRYLPVSTATYRQGQISITNTVDYDKIIQRYKDLKRMTEFLYSLFPNLGPFTDGPYFDTFVYHALLNAAYENNDYESAKVFAQNDPTHGWASKMARTKLSFKLFRFYRNKIKHSH